MSVRHGRTVKPRLLAGCEMGGIFRGGSPHGASATAARQSHEQQGRDVCMRAANKPHVIG